MDQLAVQAALHPLVAWDIFLSVSAFAAFLWSIASRNEAEIQFVVYQELLRNCLAAQKLKNCNLTYADSQFWKNLALIVLLCVLFSVTIRRLLTRLLQFCGFGPNGIVAQSRVASLRRWAIRHQYRMCIKVLRKLEGAGINGFSAGSSILMALVGCVIGRRVGLILTYKF